MEFLQSLETAELLSKDEIARLEAAMDAVADPSKAPASPPGIVDPAARRHENSAPLPVAPPAADAARPRAHEAATDAGGCCSSCSCCCCC